MIVDDCKSHSKSSCKRDFAKVNAKVIAKAGCPKRQHFAHKCANHAFYPCSSKVRILPIFERRSHFCPIQGNFLHFGNFQACFFSANYCCCWNLLLLALLMWEVKWSSNFINRVRWEFNAFPFWRLNDQFKLSLCLNSNFEGYLPLMVYCSRLDDSNDSNWDCDQGEKSSDFH